jgi:monoamine oxidase
VTLDGTRIVIAGAGLAGLTAAHALTRRGATVDVIEARNRVGGRVWTIRDPADGLHVEAGGEFIDEEHTEIRTLAAELRLPLVRVLKRGFGLALTVGGRVRVSKSQQELWKDLARILRRPVRAYKSAGCDWNTTAAAAIARHSVASVLDSGRASLRARAGAEALRGFYLADPDRLSALVLVDQIASTGNPARAVMYRIADGADRLVESLARSVHGRISLRHVVRGVTQHARGVRVATIDPAGRHKQVDADYAVIALPAALVTSCHFAPSLPAHQLRALRSLREGAATKLFFGSMRSGGEMRSLGRSARTSTSARCGKAPRSKTFQCSRFSRAPPQARTFGGCSTRKGPTVSSPDCHGLACRMGVESQPRQFAGNGSDGRAAATSFFRLASIRVFGRPCRPAMAGSCSQASTPAAAGRGS